MSTEITITSTTIDINVSEYPITIEAPSGAYPLPTSVYSVFGRTGNVVAAEGDYTLTQLAGVTITSPSAGQALVYNGTSWVNNTETYVGTVTSVAATVPTGLTITGSPITTSGTLAFGLQTGYSIPTTANQATWTTAYNDSIVSAAVTGTTTKTLTLNQQDGGTVTANWSDLQPVTSVFGRTGAVVATSGDYNTLQVTENTNLYFTDQRARYAVSGDTASGVVYSNATGIIALDDIPNTSLINSSVTVNGSTVALGGTTSFTTTAVTEGTNLYYTDTRARAAITGTAPISVASGVVSISQSGSSTNGYLSSADWNTFNGKQSALTLGNLTSSDITVTGGTGAIIGAGSTLTLATVNTNVGAYGDSTNVPTITVNAKGLVTAASQTAIPTATSSVTGLLTSADWSTFNDKQAQLNGTGFVKASGTTITYDNSTYLTTISGIAAGGELSGTYANPTLVNSAVTGKVLTGVNITGGTVVDTDSILTAFGKVQNQINGLIGGSIYKGTWNANTNTPTLTSSVGTSGNYYIVSVAGTTNLDGITDWQIGDWVIYQGSEWEKVDNTDAVVSVNGYTGAVSLTTTDISEGTNLYYTDVRARTSLSASTGISYNSTTGVITNSLPDQTVTLTGAGTTSISGAYPSFTITSNDTYNGTVTSVAVTESGSALTITGSPVTTSGTINIGFAGAASQYVAGDGSLVTFPSIPSISGLVPYTGATNNVDLGTHSLTATDLVVNHASGNGVAASITKGGNGEALTVVKSSGSGNAASITGGVTQLDELHLTTDLADTYIASATTWNAKQNAITLTTTGNSGASTLVGATLNVPTYTLAGLGGINLTSISATSPLLYNNTTGVFSIQQSSGSQAGYLSSADWTTFNGKESALTFSSPLVRTTNTISIPAATTSVNGYLTSTDWTTFNNKQSTITNPVTGTGTTNYLPKFTGTSTIGDSAITDNGTTVTLVSRALSGTSATFSGQIGIGTTATKALEILSNTSQDGIKISGSSSPRLTIIDTTNSVQFDALVTDTEAVLRTDTNHPLVLSTNGTARLTIASTGAATFSSSVSTGGALNITVPYSASTMTILTQDNLGNGIYLGPRSNLNFDYGVAGNTTAIINNFGYQNGSAHFRSLGIGNGKGGTIAFFDGTSGNVGIGTSSPTAKLHVLTNSGVSSLFETQAGLLPTYQYRRSGASLANLTNGDAVASMDFIARANSSWLTIAQIYAEYSGNGTTQTGNLQFYTANAGSLAERMRITSGGLVGIGVAPTQSAALTFADSLAQKILLNNNANNYRIDLAAAVNGGDALIKFVAGSVTAGEVGFYTTTNLRMLINNVGNVGIGTSSPTATLHTEVNSSTWVAKIINTNTTTNNAGLLIKAGVNSGNEVLLAQKANGTTLFLVDAIGKVMVNTTDSGANALLYASASSSEPYPLGSKATTSSQGLVGFFDNANSLQGSISISGATVSYNSFLGSHWSQLSDNSKTEILTGTILETIDELCEWDGVIDERLPKVKISDIVESKNVYGVFSNWDNTDDYNDMYVAALGAGFIRINSNVSISLGDLLQSNGDGTAKIQSDDIMRSSTIAKVTSTQKIETYEDGSYLIAATLHCG